MPMRFIVCEWKSEPFNAVLDDNTVYPISIYSACAICCQSELDILTDRFFLRWVQAD